MRRTSAALLTTVLAAGAVATASAPAQAAPLPPATAKIHAVSPVALPGAQDRAMVSATFSCTGRISHLWVSAKQGPGDLTQEGSSSLARAWYQSSLDGVVKCDGRRHTRIVQIQRVKGDLKQGRAYVQVCLVTGNTPEEMQEGSGGFASDMRYRWVYEL